MAVANSAVAPASRAAVRAPRPWLLLCCVVVAVLASYLPVLGAPFMWDDHHLIERSPLVRELHPLRDYFGQGFWQDDDLEQGRTYYRPLVVLSLAVDQQVYGGAPGGFHFSNLLVHVISTVLLFRLLRVRGAGGGAAVLGTALWALHPRLTEAVAWISGRTDVLATCFVLGALLAQARANWLGRVACSLLLLLGLMCKEVALAGVAAALATELVGVGPLVKRAQRALPLVAMTLLYALLRSHAAGIVAARPPRAAGLFLPTAAAIGHYFWMLLTPWFPNLQIGLLSQPSLGFGIAGCAVVLALGIAAWSLVRRWPGNRAALAGPIALIAVGFGLVLHVVPFSINVVAADRFLYLPLAGIVLLATPLLAAAAQVGMLAGVCSLFALSFGVATFQRANAWSDEVELWTSTYRDTPDTPSLACSELGRLYARAGLFAHAISIDSQCRVTPSVRLVLVNNAASLLARTGHYVAATRLLESLGADAQRAAIFGLNRTLFQTYANDFQAARQTLAHTLLRDPKYADGLALAQRLPELERDRQRVDALPESAAVERARLFAKLGLAVEALRAWQVALAQPGSSRADLEEGVSFALSQGDARTSEAFYRQYLARFGEQASPTLNLAYGEHRILGERLLAAWPSLNLKLLPLQP